MEWPTVEIGLTGAAGEESLAHEWPVEQLGTLGPFLQFADVFAAALTGTRWKGSSREARPSEPPRRDLRVPMGRLLALPIGGIAKEASEGGMT